MEYIFGNDGKNETLKTVGYEHSDLAGYVEARREYADCTIKDRFHIVRKRLMEEDPSGKCYDFYIIDQHYRYEDRTQAIQTATADHDEVIADLVERVINLELGI